MTDKRAAAISDEVAEAMADEFANRAYTPAEVAELLDRAHRRRRRLLVGETCSGRCDLDAG